MPPSARAKRPFFVNVAPVNAPRTWPKSSDSSSVSGIAAQLTLMSGMLRWRAARVDGARDQLLAGAGLAGDEHRALRFGDQLRPRDHVEDRAAAADDAVVIVFGVAFAEQVTQAGAGALIFQGPPGEHQQLFDLERFLQVVARAELHGLDGALDAAVRGHHDHRRPLRFGRRRREVADDVEAGAIRHQEVDHQQVDGPLAEQPRRVLRIRCGDHFVPVVAQRAAERLQDLFFVVCKQDAASHI